MKYFAYGMNVDPEGMARRCPDAKLLGVAVLKDHRLVFRGGFATVEPALGNNVKGVLWKITEKDLRTLDIFESYPDFYERKKVDVIATDVVSDVIVYYMKRVYHLGYPNPNTEEAMLKGYVRFGIDVEQIDRAVKFAEQEYIKEEEKIEIKEAISEIRERAEEIYQIIDEVKDILKEVDPEGLEQAETYWIAHIDRALENRGGYLGSSIINLEDTIDRLKEKVRLIKSTDCENCGGSGIISVKDTDGAYRDYPCNMCEAGKQAKQEI